MFSLLCASGSGFGDSTALKRPCCAFGKCSGLEIEGMRRPKMARCSGDVAMGLHLTMVLM